MSHAVPARWVQGEPVEECSFAKSCRYLAQFRDTAPAIRILPHASMFVRRNKDLPAPDLIVIDESFWADSRLYTGAGPRPADRSGALACPAEKDEASQE